MSLLQDRIARFRQTGIYLVLGGEFCAGRSVFEVLEAAAAGGVKTVQLREKHLTPAQLYPLAVKFRRECTRLGVLMLVDDYTDLALACGADGVHLGQDDLPVSAARFIAPDLLIGCSTHNRQEAEKAVQDGAGYINIGPVFATQTKSLPMVPVGTALIREMAPELTVPFSVMGGIKAGNLAEVVHAGAKIAAMVTEITRAPDVTAKVRELERILRS